MRKPINFIAALVLFCVPLLAAAELRFGFVDPHEGDEVVKSQALGAYFSEALATRVTALRYPPNRLARELMNGSLNFALVNPVTAVEVIDHGAATPIATLKVQGRTYFAGAIIARRDRRIASLADLKGKDVLAHQKSSAGAYVFQLYHLLRNGIDPYRDLKSLRQNNRQDDIALAVHAGRIDAGFVRSGILEALAAEGRIKLDDLIVIDERNDELTQKHTTDLYPELYLLASTRLHAAQQEQLRLAALSLRPEMPAARAAGIDGFVAPAGLDKVRQALRALRLPPYDY